MWLCLILSLGVFVNISGKLSPIKFTSKKKKNEQKKIFEKLFQNCHVSAVWMAIIKCVIALCSCIRALGRNILLRDSQ